MPVQSPHTSTMAAAAAAAASMGRHCVSRWPTGAAAGCGCARKAGTVWRGKPHLAWRTRRPTSCDPSGRAGLAWLQQHGTAGRARGTAVFMASPGTLPLPGHAALCRLQLICAHVVLSPTSACLYSAYISRTRAFIAGDKLPTHPFSGLMRSAAASKSSYGGAARNSGRVLLLRYCCARLKGNNMH